MACLCLACAHSVWLRQAGGRAGLTACCAAAHSQLRESSWVPEVAAARARVQLRLGLLTRALYALRPGMPLMLLLGGAALSALLGGSVAATVFFLIWLYTVAWGPAAGAAGEGEEGAMPGGTGEEESDLLAGSSAELSLGDEAGSISGFSEVESGGPARLRTQGRCEQGYDAG